MNQIIQDLTDAMSTLVQLIEEIPKDLYSKKTRLLSQSSIGMHCRHMVEFYQCLLSQYPEGFVNYDLRKRNIEIETNVQAFFLEVKTCLSTLKKIQTDQKLLLNSGVNMDTKTISVSTTLGRELIYVLEHTVHHMAIIRMSILDMDPNFSIPEQFGFAKSTIYANSKQD